jgi:hypothetical protein
VRPGYKNVFGCRQPHGRRFYERLFLGRRLLSANEQRTQGQYQKTYDQGKP